MAYRRRSFKRKYRRRYRRRRSRRYRKKAGRPNGRPWGRIHGNPFRAPRSNKCFKYPMSRSACLRSTVSFTMNNPIYEFSGGPYVTPTAAGKVARWELNPFHWTHPYKYDSIANQQTAVGIQGDPRYRFRKEIEADYKEYSPLKAYYNITCRQIAGPTPQEHQSPVIGCFITGRNAVGASALVTPVWDGSPTHTELETWKAFPGMTHFSQKRTNTSNSPATSKTFKGVVRAIDFSNNRVSTLDNQNINNNYFPFNAVPATAPGTFPIIYLWSSNPIAANDVNWEIQVRMTLLFRVRKMTNLDPLAN